MSFNGTTLTKANREWSARPADQRFDTMEALAKAARAYRNAARQSTVGWDSLRAIAQGADVVLQLRTGKRAHVSHHAFGQLCARAGAPAGYLRDLPAPLAAQCLTESLAERGRRDDGADAAALLFRADTSDLGLTLRAAVTPKYSRIWNCDVADALVRLQERQPTWGFPEAFRSATGHAGWGEKKTLPVAFLSDHDCFIFLADYEHTVDCDGDMLFRGFFVENSEVGAAAFKLTTFLFDMVCGNVLVWGAKHVREIKVRHVGNAEQRAINLDGDTMSAIEAFGSTTASSTVAQIRAAKGLLLGDDEDGVVSALAGKRITGLTQTAIRDAMTVAKETPRYGDPRSVWGIVNGLTEVSQREEAAEDRIALDRAAGKVLEIAF